MKYKLLILDLDGTTVEPNGESLPSAKVAEAVRQAQKHLHVAIATGRPWPLTKHVIDALGLKGLGVVSGGPEIVEMETGKVVYVKKLEMAVLQNLVKLCLPFGYGLFTKETQYGTPFTSHLDIKADAEELYVDAVKSADAILMLEELEAVPGVAAHPTKSWTKGDVVDIHVTHEHATKRYGVERLVDMLGLTKEEVIAIGDDHNDVPLMMAAGFKVAMGDAPEQVKALADFVTETLENDGVAAAINEIILKNSV